MKYLGDAGAGLVGFLLIAPVTGRQRVLETISDDTRLDCQLQVKVFAAVDKLLSIQTYLLRQIPEQAETLNKISLMTLSVLLYLKGQFFIVNI